MIDQDNYSPIPVSTEEEYRQYTSQCPFQDPELEKVENIDDIKVCKKSFIRYQVLHVASCSHVSLISSMQKLLPFRNSQEKTTSMLELAQVSFCAVCELKFE